MPISQAYYPHFSALLVQRDAEGLAHSYHKAAQLVSVIAGSLAFLLIAFGDHVVFLWTHDLALAQRISPLVSALALGTLLNGLLWIPHQMQLAHGITRLAVRTNLVAILVVLPALWWITPRYGALGAAWVWVALNTGYLIFNAHLMYRRILQAERRAWYLQDVGLPVLALAAVAAICHLWIPCTEHRYEHLPYARCGAIRPACRIVACSTHRSSLAQERTGVVVRYRNQPKCAFMSEPKITVIIPARERCDVLGETLKTVLAQTTSTSKSSFSDNHSADHTRDVVGQFNDSRLRYVNPGRRLNMSHHWEFALTHVDSGWLTILGDDDGLLPGALTKVSSMLRDNPVEAIRSRVCGYGWPSAPGTQSNSAGSRYHLPAVARCVNRAHG